MEEELNTIKNELAEFREKVKKLNESGETESTPEISQQFHQIRNLQVATILKAIHGYFDESKNPLCAWEAFHLSKDSEMEIPEWVLSYFYTSAVNLITADNVGSNVAPMVCSALGMSKGEGKRGVFLRYEDFKTQLHGASLAIKMNKLDPGRKLLNDIYDAVGKKFDVTNETVKKWVTKYKKFAEPIVDLEMTTGFSFKYSPGYPMIFVCNPPK